MPKKSAGPIVRARFAVPLSGALTLFLVAGAAEAASDARIARRRHRLRRAGSSF